MKILLECSKGSDSCPSFLTYWFDLWSYLGIWRWGRCPTTSSIISAAARFGKASIALDQILAESCGETSAYKIKHYPCNTWAISPSSHCIAWCLLQSPTSARVWHTHRQHTWQSSPRGLTLAGPANTDLQSSFSWSLPTCPRRGRTDLSWQIHLAPNPAQLTTTWNSSARLAKVSTFLCKTFPPIHNYHDQYNTWLHPN